LSTAQTHDKTLKFGQNATRNKYIKNYVFSQSQQGQEVELTMTALVGHLMETDFTGEYRNWQSVPIASLFEAPIVKHVKPVICECVNLMDNLCSNYLVGSESNCG
jgi:DNA topoisomerase-3